MGKFKLDVEVSDGTIDSIKEQILLSVSDYKVLKDPMELVIKALERFFELGLELATDDNVVDIQMLLAETDDFNIIEEFIKEGFIK